MAILDRIDEDDVSVAQAEEIQKTGDGDFDYSGLFINSIKLVTAEWEVIKFMSHLKAIKDIKRISVSVRNSIINISSKYHNNN